MRAIAIALLSALILFTSAAAAAAAYEIEASGPEAHFLLNGSNGYGLEVEISPGVASVTVARRPGSAATLYASSNYASAPSVVKPNRVRASLGGLGGIDLRFRPSGKVRRTPPAKNCKGGVGVTRYGVFIGRFSFLGEDGYTSAAARRIKGTMTAIGHGACNPPSEGGERGHRPPTHPGPLLTTFTATEPEGDVSFTAMHDQRDPTATLLFASDSESAGRVVVNRTAFLDADGGAFVFDPTLNSATIVPPDPFAGGATFQRTGDFGSSWQGDLTISFPGKPNVPLTGRGFSWSLTSKREPVIGKPEVSAGGFYRSVARWGNRADRVRGR